MFILIAFAVNKSQFCKIYYISGALDYVEAYSRVIVRLFVLI